MATTYFPFIRPDNCQRIAVRPTSRAYAGQHVAATRKQYDVYHIFKYNYGILSSRQFRIIDDHFRTMDGGKTSFWIADWGDPRPISAISGDDVIVNNTQGFSVNSGDGGNIIILWENSGDYGDDCTVSGNVITDPRKAWTTDEWENHRVMDSVGNKYSASDNTSKTLRISTASTIMPGAYDIYRFNARVINAISISLGKLTLTASPGMTYTTPVQKFVIPVYECFYAQDSLGLVATEGFNLEANDNYGPYYSGSIDFIQKGTGT